MAKYISDRHVQIYKNVISQVRQDLGAGVKVDIYLTPTKLDCAWCIYDPIAKRSSGKPSAGYDWATHPNYTGNTRRCPNCNGIGTIDENNIVSVTNVTYRELKDEELIAKVGLQDLKWVRLAMNLSYVLVNPSDVNSHTYFDNAVKVMVYGKTYEVRSVKKRGLRDLFTCQVELTEVNK